MLCPRQDFTVSCNEHNKQRQVLETSIIRGGVQQLPTLCTVSRRRPARADIGNNSKMAFHDIRAKTLDGQVVSMDKYKGKVVLVENTASL